MGRQQLSGDQIANETLTTDDILNESILLEDLNQEVLDAMGGTSEIGEGNITTYHILDGTILLEDLSQEVLDSIHSGDVPVDVNTGIIHEYTFTNSNGGEVNDEVGNINVSLYNGAKIRSGNGGSVMYCDGNNDYAEVNLPKLRTFSYYQVIKADADYSKNPDSVCIFQFTNGFGVHTEDNDDLVVYNDWGEIFRVSLDDFMSYNDGDYHRWYLGVEDIDGTNANVKISVEGIEVFNDDIAWGDYKTEYFGYDYVLPQGEDNYRIYLDFFRMYDKVLGSADVDYLVNNNIGEG